MYRRQGRPRQSAHIFPAPSAGWIKNQTLIGAQPNAAEVLDNFFPTAQGARARKGSVKKATVDAGVVELLTYEGIGGANALYAATANDVFDVTAPADPEVAETPVMSLFTSGEWSQAHFSTSAGDYVVAVNGADYAFYNDGSSLNPIADEAVNDLAYDALTGEFTLGDTVTGGTSGATATILGDHKTSATAGTLKIGTITGTFQDDETITDGSTGSATSDIPSGTSSASSITITGVATTALSQVFQHQRRLWFVEGGTMSAWYLPTVSIGGAANEFLFGSLFRRGGSLLFGINWTLDSGEGLDDLAVFVTTEGEVAVYAGTDPNTASTWVLQGLYDVGRPLNKNSWFRSAGDVQIVTEDGIVSLTKAMQFDRAALQQDALTYPIEDEWQKVVANRSSNFRISATLWQAQTMLVVGVPDIDGANDIAFVANARTGAWGRFIGWDVRCSTVLGDDFYFGTDGSTVWQGETTGMDGTAPYVCRWAPKFAEMGTPQTKFATYAQFLGRASEDFSPTIQMFSNYTIQNWKAAPLAATSGASVWGTGIWGTSTWGALASLRGVAKWKGVRGQGFALTPGVQITVGDTPDPEIELAGVLVQFEVGSVV